MTEPRNNEELRASWGKLAAESLNESARRLGAEHPDVTVKVLKNERFRNPDGFPKPIPIDGSYHNSRLSVYSAHEVDLWVRHGRDLAKAPKAEVRALRGEVRAVCRAVKPVQLSHAASVLLPDVEAGAAVRRVRSWRTERHANGFPDPLDVHADYVIASMVFSLREILDWSKARAALRRTTDYQAARAEALSARAARGAATRAARAAADA